MALLIHAIILVLANVIMGTQAIIWASEYSFQKNNNQCRSISCKIPLMLIRKDLWNDIVNVDCFTDPIYLFQNRSLGGIPGYHLIMQAIASWGCLCPSPNTHWIWKYLMTCPFSWNTFTGIDFPQTNGGTGNFVYHPVRVDNITIQLLRDMF